MATKSQRAKRRSRRLLAAAPPKTFSIEAEQRVEFLAAAADEGDALPKLPTFKMLVYAGGRMRPLYFYYDVIVDLSTAKVAEGPRPSYRDHDRTKIVGHAEVKIDKGKIVAEGVLSGVGPAADEVRQTAANGFPWKSSLGAETGRLEFIEQGTTVEVNGKKYKGPLYVAHDVLVHEVSFVSLAGDAKSSAKVAASFSPGASSMTFEQWLQANGFDAATISDVQRTTLKAAFDAQQIKPEDPPPIKKKKIAAGAGNPEEEEDDDEPVDPAKTLRASEAQEVARLKAVRAICAKHPDLKFKAAGPEGKPIEEDLEVHAIREGWTADAAELYALRAARPAPSIHTRSHDADCNLAALQGAMILRAGLTLDNKLWASRGAVAMNLPEWLRRGLNEEGRQRAMEASHRYSDLSMVDLCAQAVRLDGNDCPHNRRDMIQASFSGSSLSNIFTTNVNTVILSTYMEAPDTTNGWVREADVADFKTNERPRMTKGPNLERLPAGQTASHATRSDLVESYKIARYAKQFVVDEQDIIDDSFGALTDTPTEMGLAAARLRPDLVYYILMSNPALGADSVAIFHADHGNLNTTAALAAATLKAAIADIELQRENSVNLNLRASHLIVPPSLKHAAAELINSSTIQIGWGADDETLKERGTLNTINSIESLTSVADARLENGVTDPVSGSTSSGSASTWFVASAMGHTIEVGYLRGTGRVPQVRSFVLDRGTWGIGWDVKHDIGAKALDYHGLHKNTA
jgi:Mu-like prophage major head subunit gpT